MRIVEASKVAPFDNPHGVVASRLHSTEHVQVVQITLQPGESLKLHTTPVDVFFYALEGTGICQIADERREVGVDTLVPSPAGIPHLLANESEEPFRFLVVKTPNPSGREKEQTNGDEN